MRTIKSALFIALCLLFATYAAASRPVLPRGPTVRYVTKHRQQQALADDIWRGKPWSPPVVMADKTLPFERRPWAGPSRFAQLSDEFNEKVDFNQVRERILAGSKPNDKLDHPWWRPILLSDKAKPWNGGTPPFNPFPDQSTMPVRPKYELYSDAEAEVFPPTWGQPPPFNPYPTRPVLFSDAEAEIMAPTTTLPWKPWLGTTGPYAPDIRPNIVFADDILEEDEEFDEDYDEEQFGINGSIGSGGAWNLGGSYNTQIGRNGNLNIGGSVGNGGQWGVNVGYTWTF